MGSMRRMVGLAASLIMLAVPLQECSETPPTDPPVSQPPTTCVEQAQSTPDGGGEGIVVSDDSVVGGRDSIPGCRTYQAMLVVDTPGGKVFFCGGTVIADFWVLTAAHCLEGLPPQFALSAVLNAHEVNGAGATEIPVAERIIHPQYQSFGNSYDIALLRLTQPADPSLVRAYLPDSVVDQATTGVNQLLTISGWGVVDGFTGASPTVLQEVELPVREPALCSTIGAAMTSREICTGGATPTVSGCFGDSGGPLATRYEGNFYVSGVVSYGDATCDFRTVFTRVASFVDWIDATTGGGQVVIGPVTTG